MKRREFIKKGMAAGAGLSITPSLLTHPHIIENGTATRLVRIVDDQAVHGSTLQAEVVQAMVDAGICALAGSTGLSQAWHSLMPGLNVYADRVAIKVNAINMYLPTHPEVAFSLAQSLISTGLPENHILIWDRGNADLIRSGYVINESTGGVRVYGTGRSGIADYDPQPFLVHDESCFLSRIVTEYAKYVINVSCLKASGAYGAGVTLCLKNHYGSLSLRPDSYSGPVNGKLHDNYCNPYIPALNAIPVLRSKQILAVCDALFGNSYTNLEPPNFTYKGLIMSRDSVAVDALGKEVLKENGCTITGSAVHIPSASGAPYYLGTSDLSRFDLVELLNPYTGEHGGTEPSRPLDFSLFQNYPNPFNPVTWISFDLPQESNVLMDVYNARGDFIRRLAHRRMEAGTHRLPWDGKDDRGMPLASGLYFCRLEAGGYVKTIGMVKVK